MANQITINSLRTIVEQAYYAAIAAVDPISLVSSSIRRLENTLYICDCPLDLTSVGKIIVIGTGKAAGPMALGFEKGILNCLDGNNILAKVTGLINVVEGTALPTKKIILHPARPPGANAVTEQVIAGTEEMLKLIADLGPNDIVIDLISGGGSALRERLIDGLTLGQLAKAQKILEKRDIVALNAVRKLCSQVKGGQMNLRTKAGCVIAMVLSDVVGDPLDVIASGPWAENQTSPEEALDVLWELDGETEAEEVFQHIESLAASKWIPVVPGNNVQQKIIGNNQTALAAMADFFRNSGIAVRSDSGSITGNARDVGIVLGAEAEKLRSSKLESLSPQVLLYGGETTVDLDLNISDRTGGGRNQTIVLAALQEFWIRGEMSRVAIFSFGTDGEDGRGPTVVAGAYADQKVFAAAKAAGLDPTRALARNDEFPFFAKSGGHFTPGLTGTNVCDLWGVIVLPN